MAEIKVDQRQTLQPSAPDISIAGNAYGNLGSAIEAASSLIGDVVQANRKLEEKSLLAGATQELERLHLKYKANPELSLEGVAKYREEAALAANNWLTSADKKYLPALSKDLNEYNEKLVTKLMGEAYKREVANSRRDIGVAINELQNTYTQSISEGDLDLAAKTKANLAELLAAYQARGATAKEIIGISEKTESMGVATDFISKLKRAPDENARINVMQEMTKLPDTRANNAAFNEAYKEFSRLNRLYKEGEDLAGPIKNSMTGNAWLNQTLDATTSDKLVSLFAKNIANRSNEPPKEVTQSAPVYQALPAYPGQVPTYDFNEEINAWREKRDIRRYLANETVQGLEAPEKRTPSLFELAQAHVMVGSANSTEFPKEVTNRLLAGPGLQANEAVEAITFVSQAAPSTLSLDAKTDMVYSEFKVMKDAGRTDYDQMIKEARAVVNDLKDSDIKLYNDAFNQQFSTIGPRAKDLNKAFIEATKTNAITTRSLESFNDFYRYFRNAYILSRGNTASALNSAKREIKKTHGADLFSAITSDVSPLFSVTGNVQKSYVRYPPTKMMAGLTEQQINNQLIEQLVALSERNDNIQVQDGYKRIKNANDIEKMDRIYSFRAPSWSIEKDSFRPGSYIKQKIEGIGEVEGRVFLKSNPLTVQNNTGMPVWEIWMQDRVGNEFPGTDNSSPYNNIALFYGQSPETFAPEWAKAKAEKDIDDAINQALSEEARSLYPIISLTPVTSFLERKAYTEDLKNIERIRPKIEKILKGEEKENP